MKKGKNGFYVADATTVIFVAPGPLSFCGFESTVSSTWNAMISPALTITEFVVS